jgi:UDP-N-acetylglucosamine 2-epimerase (non-hydrolysing)
LAGAPVWERRPGERFRRVEAAPGARAGRRLALCVVGTRPEAIKMFSVVRALRERDTEFQTLLCSSGQHAELLDDALATFGLTPDHDLAAMRHDQQPADVVWSIARWMTDLCRHTRPDVVVVQGDTATTTAAGLAGFYSSTRVAHVEAGLRSYDNYAPWPEEANRRVVGAVADLHFAPSELAAENLLREGVGTGNVHVTGNTGIDALRWALAQPRALPKSDRRRRVVVTAHRRESIPEGLEAIARAVRRLARLYPEMVFQFMVHPAPAVTRALETALPGAKPANLELLAPCGYVPFVQMLADSHLILTDSGGLQEEGPALGKPVLVVSHRTERQEGLAAGAASIAGADEGEIVAAATRLLDDSAHYARMATQRDLYGDGRAGERIAAVLAERVRAGAAVGEPALG